MMELANIGTGILVLLALQLVMQIIAGRVTAPSIEVPVAASTAARRFLPPPRMSALLATLFVFQD